MHPRPREFRLLYVAIIGSQLWQQQVVKRENRESFRFACRASGLPEPGRQYLCIIRQRCIVGGLQDRLVCTHSRSGKHTI